MNEHIQKNTELRLFGFQQYNVSTAACYSTLSSILMLVTRHNQLRKFHVLMWLWNIPISFLEWQPILKCSFFPMTTAGNIGTADVTKFCYFQQNALL